MAAAAPAWADIRRRHEASKARQQAHHSRLWEGYSVGSVVILGPNITKDSYGLDLCDDNGESVLMDGEILQIEGEFATVKIGRHQGKAAPGCGPMIGELHQVRRSSMLIIS